MMFTNTKYLKSIHKDIKYKFAGYVYWHHLDMVNWGVSVHVKNNIELTTSKLKISKELF